MDSGAAKDLKTGMLSGFKQIDIIERDFTC
jgi:hypothetical protein